MCRANSTEGSLEKRAQFFHPIAHLETHHLKLVSEEAHVRARRNQPIYPVLRQLLGLCEIAAIAHDNAVSHPAREGGQVVFAIIDRGRGQLKAAESPGFVTLDIQLKAVPPPHTVLGFVRPLPKGAVLARARHVTDGNRRGVLPHDGIWSLGVAVAIEV